MERKSIDHVVIRFSGDSGDGMQLTGNQFSQTSALMGNDLATFPDFPAEIRAPQGTVAGVSGFQVHFGSSTVLTPGDEPNILIAMNPAALKANIDDVPTGGTVIYNSDAFVESAFTKAGYTHNPLESGELSDYHLIAAPISTQVKTALEEVDLDTKSKLRCKNFYALGMTYFLYARDLTPTLKWIEEKFAGKEDLIKANSMALKAGYNYAETIEAFNNQYEVKKAAIEKGLYRQISGNQALALGFLLASEKSGHRLMLGSYPITPASDILHELSQYKSEGVVTFQAEDEIAAISSAIGASFGGALGLTTSSGPGIALKSEALNLAIMLELPLVMVNVQRGGPSTGLPTKTEQSDFNMVMYGRNGESPAIILAAKAPSDCFSMAYEAARLSLTHMTPVILMSDGYIANGSEPWKIPDTDKDFKEIKSKLVSSKSELSDEFFIEGQYLPYKRDEDLIRAWATPGTEGLEHRLGGLEKQIDTGNVSYDPLNHEAMVKVRAEKVAKVANDIPAQKLEGEQSGDLLLISWGGTYGAMSEARTRLAAMGMKISLMHLQYLNPLPTNVESLMQNFKHHLVCELNLGQMKNYLQSLYGMKLESYNKVQGKPFKVKEIVDYVRHSYPALIGEVQ